MRKRTKWRLLRNATAALLFVNLIALAGMGRTNVPQVLSDGSAEVASQISAFWSALSPVQIGLLQALITATAAFAGVAWQTRKGFDNLRRSQIHQANLNRGARLEELQRTREESGRKSQQDARDLASGLRGELRAYVNYTVYQWNMRNFQINCAKQLVTV